MFNLKLFRKDYKLKQSEVGDLFGIGQTTVSEIDTMKRGLTEEQEKIFISHFGQEVFDKYAIPEICSQVTSTNISKGVPYFEDIEATGSIISCYDDYPEIPSFYINYAHFNDCDAYLTVVGDSMYPKYCAGEIIAVKRMMNLDALLPGEAHLVVTNANANDLRTVKLVFPDDDRSRLVLRASNPNFRGDIIINKADIISMFIVKGKITRNQL